MPRFIKGIVYTNNNCIGCNRCISQCSITGSNISLLENGVPSIKVDSRKCIHCGNCINLCVHDARAYDDDTDALFESLKAGEKISLVVSSSFFEVYNDVANKVLGYLKSLGVEKIYDASFGAEISVWGHVKYLKTHINDSVRDRRFIANTCPAVINMIQSYHPELVKKIIPVHSPMLCTAIYARKYLGDTNKIAFISPCVAQKDEIESKKTEGIANFNVTYAHLMDKISIVDISTYNATADVSVNSLPSLYSKAGIFNTCVAAFFPRNVEILSLSSLSEDTTNTLRDCIGKYHEESQPLMVEISACKSGCYAGPGIERNKYESERIRASISKKMKSVNGQIMDQLTYEQRWNHIEEAYAKINFDDFSREYEDKFKQPLNVPDHALNEIFDEMLKNTEEKRRINCGSCGYQSCHQMAKSIAYGYNKKENCIHYMQDEMTIRYFTDLQTGLPNREQFNRKVIKMLRENPDKQYVILCGDINRLKVINDLHSFQTGTEVIKRVGKQLQQCCGATGLAARLGGGTLAAIMDYTPANMQQVYNLKHFDCSDIGVSFPVTLRFGLFIRQTGFDITEMLNCATICMDTVVSIAQNTFTLFTKDYREKSLLEANITAKMQPALDNGEFHIWFQPQYEVGTGVLYGAETLCRWIKPDGSIIPPGIFIPIAEKNGFIRILDKYIWRQAFMTMKNWLDEGITPVPISVNISRVSLENDALIFVIKRLGDEFQIPPEYIHFEITESAYMDDQHNMLYRINEIRKLGYQIAMDDFGSGYSSLNSLKDIPIDILKLDMGFMRGSTNVDKGAVIISSIIQMAKALKLKTVAEGVESESQASFLEGLGCDIIQGYLYAKPMPEEKYRDLFV